MPEDEMDVGPPNREAIADTAFRTESVASESPQYRSVYGIWRWRSNERHLTVLVAGGGTTDSGQ